MTSPKKTVVLIIIDGFGYSEDSKYNAVKAADAPVWEKLWKDGPQTLIHTSGLEVGLPEGQMGNSEVGHMTLGAGRVVYQNFTRINKAIVDGDFQKNTVYTQAIDKAVAAKAAVHILGLLSPGGVHSHEDHIFAMIELAAQRGAKKIYLHAFLDGRDVAPRSAKASLQKAEKVFARLGVGEIASVCGRFFALDRDKRWDRVEAAYNLIAKGEADYQSSTATDALEAAYQREENDEFVKATRIGKENSEPVAIVKNDSVIFMNFRPDRAREISQAFVDESFDDFPREYIPLSEFVQTTEYSSEIKAPCAFPPENLKNSIGEYLANQGKTQLRIAETEKYAHVTFFFSGGQESLYKGEDRILVPSPDVATYDLKPEMSAVELTDKLVSAIESRKYDSIICNYANCDQVGHSGVFDAAVKAVEAVDACLARILVASKKAEAELLITADHGNVEVMFDEETNQAMTQHTTLPVPLVYVGHRKLSLKPRGSLADIAPTMLALMEIEQPQEMTGDNLAIIDKL